MRSLLFILILSALSSCSRVFLLIIGGRMPQIETFESIKQYAEKWDIEESNIFLLNADYLNENYSGPSNKILLFDKNGYSIDLTLVGEDPRCGGNIYGFMKGLGKQTYAQRDSLVIMNKITENTFHIDHKKSVIIDQSSDYHILFYWNCFMGKERNKGEIEMLKEAIAGNSTIKTQLILVNKDRYEGAEWKFGYK